MKRLLFTLFMVILVSYGFCALSDYSFTQTAGTYSELPAPTVLHTVDIDDALSPVTEIGFTFVYDELPYTQFKCSSNGFITFNTTSSASQSNLLASQLLIVGGLWDDLKTDAADASVSYQLIGSAPNRSLVIQYKNLKWYYNVTPINLINFQIKLNETTNTIQYIYGTMGATPGASASASIGLSGAVAGNLMSITPGAPATFSTTTEFTQINGTHVPFLTGNMYTFSPPMAVPNDLQAMSITGSTTPSSGSQAAYTINVRNRGSSNQSNYTVKLMSGATELASVAGPVLAAGVVLPVVVNYTFTATGPMTLTGKVVLAGDQNPANDVTSPLNINVQPQGTNLVIIGTGTSNQRQPFGVYWGYERDAALYTQEQIGLFGSLTSVQWYCATTATASVPYNVYIKTTTDVAQTAVPFATMIADAQLVATGTQVFGTVGWVTIPLTVPYVYSGGNLLVIVETSYTGTGVSPYPYFQYTTGAVGSNQYWYQDTTAPTGNGTLNTNLPNIGLALSATVQTPQFAVSPTSWNYGQVFMNTTSNKAFTIVNTGGGTTPLGINTITISGSPFFTLQNLPTLPHSLPSFQNTTFVVRYIPTTAGTHTATVTITDNLTRTPHTVIVSGTCVDPTIYVPPYMQNFDTATIPNFPIEWTKITQTTAGTITTSTTSPHSMPNCAYLTNSSDATAGLYLLAPPVVNTIPLVTMRVKFWAKASDGYLLGVGVTADPNDAATYMEVSSQTLTAAWAEYVVSFQTYAGQGHYITFKHGLGGTYRAIYIDDVVIEVTPQNDLTATNFTVGAIPVVGASTPVTVDIFNWGTNQQTNYSVKLYNESNLELATVAGPPIASGVAVQATINWIPTTPGANIIHAKVVLTGDQNSLNDSSPSRAIAVLPAGTIPITVGDGLQTARMPVDMFYKNSLFETIYPAGEIIGGGNLNSIAFYNNFLTNLPAKPTKVWVGVSETGDLSAGWIPSTSLSLVYDGAVDYPSGLNTIIIPFTTPFTYLGGNLVIMVQRPLDTAYFSASDLFLCQTSGANRTRMSIDDTTPFDPTAPSMTDVTLSGQFPKTTFFFTSVSPNPIFSVSPLSNDYGQVFINTTTNKLFNIMNIGGGANPLIVNNITISGSPAFTLQSLPTLPASLSSGQTASFVVRYMPTAAGIQTATVTITDNLGRSTSYGLTRSDNSGASRTQHTIALTGTCVDPTIYTPPYVQNFDSVTVPVLPIDWSKIVQSTSGTVATSTTLPNSPLNSVLLSNSSDATAGLYLISPPIANNLPIVTMRVKFWAKGGVGYPLGVGIINSPTDAATYTEVSSQTLTAAWAEYVVGFQTYAGQGHYIAFKHGLGGTYRSIYIDDVTIEVTPQNDLAATTISGSTIPVVGVSTPIIVNVFNWGTNPQSNYTVKLYNDSNLELASAPGLQIQPGTSVAVTVNWIPATAGPITAHGTVVLTGDQNSLNNSTPNKTVVVQPAGTIPITLGDGSQTARMPVDMFYKNSLFETIFPAGEILGGGNLNSIAFYNSFLTATLVQKPTKIWCGVTEQADLSAGWIPSTSLSLVFDGNVDYPAGQNMITIPFTTPFTYAGGNFVLMVQRPLDTAFFSSSDLFFCQTNGLSRTRNSWDDTTVFDPANPSTTDVTVSGQYPMTTFFFTSLDPNPHFAISPQSYNYGQLFINTSTNKTFTIMNIGGGTTPLVISNITIAGSPFFTLQNMPAFPVSLTTGQTSSFVVRYTPTTAGTQTATITVTDNLGRSQVISLSRGASSASRSRNDNSRTQNLVQISATCVDPTIYVPPYVQSFDTVTVPALPMEWSKALATTAGTIVSSTTGPHSAPNCVILNNGSDTAGSVILVSPPLAVALPVNTMRVKFWAKGGVNYTLGVGILNSPTDAGTYIESSSVTLTAAWAEYVVAFQTYTGNGHFIGFRHGLGATYRGISIDDVTIEVTPQNDLAATSITGNSTPSVGMLSTYTVSVFNWGTNSQSAYNVKLFNSNNVELASIAGATVAPGATVQVAVPWTPTVTGAIAIYGKVVLTGDQNNLNDSTTNINLSVQPAGTVVVTIGDPSSALTQRQPFGIWFGFERNATLITTADMAGTVMGMFTGFQWYCSTSAAASVPYKIYIKQTTDTALTAVPWATMIEGATMLQEGTLAFTQTGWVPFTLTTPYLYTGGNFIIMVETSFGGSGTTPYSSFIYTAGTAGSNQYWAQDNTAPTANGTLNINRPNIGIFLIPGGVGHLNGNVYGAGNVPLQNAIIQILNGASATTDQNGHYLIPNIIAGTYQVTASRYGYISQTVSIEIPEDITVTHNFTLAQMPTVTVTGTIVGSDAPTVGIPGATISLTGYESYNATANAQGQFSIPGVYTNQTYAYTAVGLGYQNATGNIIVGTVNLNMGNVMVTEIAYTPRNVTSVQTPSQVTLTWLAPDPNAVDLTQGFENATFPPADWTRIVTNNGAANTAGVYPTWCRFGAVVDGTTNVTPSEGNWQAGFWWTYSHQDEWLITPQFSCPQGANLTFDTYVFRGSANGDHYYVKATANNGQTWTTLWDATTLTGGWNNYQTPIQIDLSAFAGQQIKLAWHADDPNATQDGMWYNWFIDNVVINNSERTIRFAESALTSKSVSLKDSPLQNAFTTQPMSRATDKVSLAYDGIVKPVISTNHKTRNHTRAIIGYKVWRMIQGQEQNEPNWTLLTPTMLTDATLTFTDATWAAASPGTYKWAVKAIYTSDVASLGAFSNSQVKIPAVTGTLVGTVRNSQNVPLAGALITAGAFTATSGPNGGYTVTLPVGTYTVTCFKATYDLVTATNIAISNGVPTTHNFTLIPTSNEDEVEVVATTLKGNYPNPFNPETTIAYDVKVKAPVRIDIYNTKGQLIRTLVNESKAKGQYTIKWNGKDNNGNPVASGVYSYRMQAGTYRATRMMMMMK